MALEDIFNFIKLEDGTGLAGMPSIEQCQDVAKAGFQSVINLAPEDADGALSDEAKIWSSLGITYKNIPVPWIAPNRSHFEEFVSKMQELDDRKVFIHCQANYRVTVFYALYAAEHLGWTHAKAKALIDQIWESRPDYKMDDTWKFFVEQGFARLTKCT